MPKNIVLGATIFSIDICSFRQWTNRRKHAASQMQMFSSLIHCLRACIGEADLQN